MTRSELAKMNFQSGLNCAQAVLLAFKDEIDLSEEDLKKSIIGFGGGFARQQLVCGAVCGMTSALGFILSDGKDKLQAYSFVKEACELFKEKAGSLICAELKSEKAVMSCAELCALAVQCVDMVIKKYKN